MEEQKNHEDEIDLTEIFKVLWKRKKIIIWGTIILTLISIIISFLIPKTYKSDAFYVLSSSRALDQRSRALDQRTRELDRQLSVPEYKKYYSVFTNPEKFIKYVKHQKQLNYDDIESLEKSIIKSEDLSKKIKPVYAYSKADLKDLAQISKDVKNYIIGINLSYEYSDPHKAKLYVGVITGFIKDSFMYGRIFDYIAENYNISNNDLKNYENSIIETNFSIEKTLNKRNNIKQILKKYPQSRSIEQRQLVSTEKGGYRYLSPIAQLVGIESTLADLKSNLEEHYRRKTISSLKYAFFKEAKKIMRGEKNGIKLFEKVYQLKDSFFKNLDLKNSVNKEVYNKIIIDLDNYHYLFYEIIRFGSGPTLPDKPIKPNKKLIVVISFFLSFFIFIFSAFIIEWWENNKKNILKKNNERKKP
jgi:LPS O-antigen subunit length determinant protein (WzzB/FepE family)